MTVIDVEYALELIDFGRLADRALAALRGE
jgi:hypothetical protein